MFTGNPSSDIRLITIRPSQGWLLISNQLILKWNDYEQMYNICIRIIFRSCLWYKIEHCHLNIKSSSQFVVNEGMGILMRYLQEYILLLNCLRGVYNFTSNKKNCQGPCTRTSDMTYPTLLCGHSLVFKSLTQVCDTKIKVIIRHIPNKVLWNFGNTATGNVI